MEAYHQENSSEYKLRSMINRIEFLFHKGLSAPCLKLIGKAKVTAKKNEMWEQLHEILCLEREVSSTHYKSVEAMKKMV